MNIFNIGSHTALILLLWGSSSSCKKEPKPECYDGSCCDGRTNRFAYIQYSEEVIADLAKAGSWGIVLKDGIKIGQGLPVTSLPLCSNCVEKVKDLEPSYTPANYLNPPLAYRVWGKVLHDTISTSITGVPMLYFYIDKIEKAK